MPQCINKREKKFFFSYQQFCSGNFHLSGNVFIMGGAIPDGLLIIWGVLSSISLASSPNGPRACFLDSLTCCCAAGPANTAVRGAMSPAAASPVKMKWRSWDLFLPRLLHGCEYPAWEVTSQQPLPWREIHCSSGGQGGGYTEFPWT